MQLGGRKRKSSNLNCPFIKITKQKIEKDFQKYDVEEAV